MELSDKEKKKLEKKQAKAAGTGPSGTEGESLPSSPTSSKGTLSRSQSGSTRYDTAPNSPRGSKLEATVSKRIAKWLGGYQSESEPSSPVSSRHSRSREEIQGADSASFSSQGSTDPNPVIQPIEAPESKPKSHLKRNVALGVAAAVAIPAGLYAAPYLITPGPGEDPPSNLPD